MTCSPAFVQDRSIGSRRLDDGDRDAIVMSRLSPSSPGLDADGAALGAHRAGAHGNGDTLHGSREVHFRRCVGWNVAERF